MSITYDKAESRAKPGYLRDLFRLACKSPRTSYETSFLGSDELVCFVTICLGTGIVAERAFWAMEESRRSGGAGLTPLQAVLEEIRVYLPYCNLLRQVQEAFPNDWSMKLVNFVHMKDRKLFEERLLDIIETHSLPGEFGLN